MPPSVVVINAWAPMREALQACLGELVASTIGLAPSVATFDAVAAIAPRLIVLDLLDVTTMELFEVLRHSRRTAHIPCLVTLSPTQHDRLAPYIGQPGVTLLLAPFTSEELLEAASRALNRR